MDLMIIRRTGGHTVLRVAAAATLALSFGALAFACVDPKGDFESYIERTNTMRGVTPDTGVADAPAFEVGDADLDAGTSLYFTSCIPQVFLGSPELSFIFLSEITLAGGKMKMTNYPLKQDATKLTKSQTVGTPHSSPEVPLGTDNTFKATIGGLTIPGNSQRVGDSDIVMADVVYTGKLLGKERICSELDGRATAPSSQDFSAPGDFCISVLLPEGADLPTFKDAADKMSVGFAAAEYHCP
jgi:hypothetical protein